MATNQPRVWLITGASSGFGRAIAEAALAVGDGRGDQRQRAARPDGSAFFGPAALTRSVLPPDPPLRLALGNDAVDAIAESLDGAKAELAAWERVGRSAVFVRGIRLICRSFCQGAG